MSQVVFAARSRSGTGSGEARRIRRAGRIPGVLYGRSGEALSIDLDALDFINGIKEISESTIVKVDVDGKAHEAFVKDTQRNILDGSVLHVDFYEVESGVAVRTRVGIHIIGSAAGVREGGILETPMHDIEVECLPKDLPERIEVDVSDLKVNQSIHIRDIKLGDAVKVLSNGDQVVALVKFTKAEAAAEEETEEAAVEEKENA